jgi:hypothetical protein
VKRKQDLELPFTLSPSAYPLFIPRRFAQVKTHLLRTIDPYLLLVWLLSLPAITPLIQPTLTRSADGLLHLYRLVALDQTIQQGLWFPRWLPDLAYGYGFPLFVFYAPLAYYITLLLKQLGLDMIAAFNTSLMLALLTAGAGVYLFVKALLGPRAGLLAGMAYVYAPFQLLNALSRGGLPAAWAMALFPFAFWAFRRLIKQGLQQEEKFLLPYLPVSALILGLALLSHNTLSLLFIPLFSLYIGVELLSLSASRLRTFQHLLAQIGLAIILALGLAAFFLMPAMLEQEFAQVHRVITSPDFDFRFNFVSLKELFSLPRPANTGLLNPLTPPTLGLAQVTLAVIGLIILVWHTVTPINPEGKLGPSKLILFTVLSLTAGIFMMLPTSLRLWEQLPLLAFVQFPHRLLGPVALVLAVLAGAAGLSQTSRWSFWLNVIGLLMLFLSHVPLLYPRYDDRLSRQPTLLDMMAYEHSSGVIGTTSFGEYLPIWVNQIPRESPLESMYQAGGPIERLDRAYLPQGATVESGSYQVNQTKLVIDSPEPYQAIFHTFYFPGWTALVNDQPAPIAPVTERGLIGVTIPAGRQELHLFFQETPLRRTANGISLLTLAALLITFIFSLRSNQKIIVSNEKSLHLTPYALRATFTQPQFLILTGLALTLTGLKLFYFDQFDNPLKRSFNSTAASALANFGDQVNLLDYELESSTAMPGQSFQLTLYWQARHALTTNYSALAHLVDEAGQIYAGQDNLHPGMLPATQWPPWGFVQDQHELFIPPGTPPGDYFLVTGLYDPATWIRLPVSQGPEPAWPDVMAIPVVVLKPDRPPSLKQLNITWPVEADVGPELRLLGATPERATLVRNDFLRLAIFWEAKRKPNQDYQIRLRLLSATGQPALQKVNQPSHNRYPTTRWSAGERVRDNHALWLPADLPAGIYRLQVQVITEAEQALGPWLELGMMK